MLQKGSPEHTAFAFARTIDRASVIDAVEEAGFAQVSNECQFVNRDLDQILKELTAREKLWVDGSYPASCISEWFHLAKTIPLADHSTAIGVACERYRQELAAELGSGKTLRSNEEPRTTIQRIAKAEKLLADALRDLRREATRPGQAATRRGAVVRDIYHSAQQTILTPLGFLPAPAGQRSPQTLIERKGAAYFGTPPELERALLRASEVSERLADNQAFWGRLPQARNRMTRARERWLFDMVSIWEAATGSPATFTGDPASAFYVWIRGAHGHLVGLFRTTAEDDDKDQTAFDKALHYKILPIPSARTLKTVLDRSKNDVTASEDRFE